ncbi:UDP-N-acetylmuramoyl-L-alanine--D-glutamate ligase [Ktedonosporobacter rubrisoli]|uniref:UDP-N-acetylmuramoylalanine--D-glutamate ligase n=1 Tax=Ktedonosporobacter rubrisoli TaxID=2509675 RepID=A0A4P6JRX8_KTERU|nr:UDP-N-acetylmuramoyl-L-alanine--D-glutamate ligase [Ktedonosporobacter rubrisoli]QBD78124.1 UDP-N-acetylmuramoyl-L-alanine--D-glutamate ligase [Ktedonosporobacter rubrisoli]
MDLRGKRVLVMGLGLQGSGMAAARYAAQQGAIVRVTDMKPAEVLAPSVEALSGLSIEFILGQHRQEDFQWADIVIRNPGVPRTSPYLKIAKEHGARIEMEIALFFLACPGRIIGITGTRGKTTTSSLIYEILRASGAPTVLGGNVAGVETLSLLPQIKAQTQVVLELSSWQLEGLEPHAISPAVAVMTNVYPDHLNTYSGIEEYAEAKANIFRHQHADDLAIFNFDNPWTRRFGTEAPANTWFTSLQLGGSFQRAELSQQNPQEHIKPFVFTETPLMGRHNLENILLATTTARLLGIDDEIIATTVRNFRSVGHRLEEVRTVNGVRFINDSTSTTPVAGRVGLEAFDAPIVLVAGGNTKHLPLEDWPATIIKRSRDVILLPGSGTDELLPALDAEAHAQGKPNPVRGIFANLKQALDTALSFTRPGDVLLFSPGFTSFGMFLNEFDRGDKFREYVHSL